MTETERLAAIEAIRLVKARYWRGVDTGDGALVRSILATDCELDFRGCCTDPRSGVDFLPVMNVVMRGRSSWKADALSEIISAHHGHQAEIEVHAPDAASAVWAFTDHLWLPEGSGFSLLVGHGHYHDTYVKEPDGWKVQTCRISRLKVAVQ
ncbi:MAG TPA: nuclear transport factor 2 family protein [Novosphingobium sp.]|nr:nuclear transport factor 2 family protein [Novosphingobium sp.]HMP55418.1 nuclear transport factor 2 family protein [Novosphingobium sp.]